jgi:hypothetical protein
VVVTTASVWLIIVCEPRTPETNRVNRPINWVFRAMTRFGLGASYHHMLNNPATPSPTT